MTKTSKILFVIFQNNFSEDVFSKTAEFTSCYNAEMDILIIMPPVSVKLEGIVREFKASIEHKIATLAKQFQIDDIGIKIEYTTAKPYSQTIAKHAEDGHYDLVVKQAEIESKGHGKAMDVDIIRKVKCPIWFCSEANYLENDRNIFIAIDPCTSSAEQEDLNSKLIAYGRLMSEFFKAKLAIISCWYCEDEIFLRDSVFSNLTDADVDDLVQKADKEHRHDLEKFIAQHNVNDIIIHRKKGKAYDVIPNMLEPNDVLVMGSVGRSGLSGFFIGNTAENIFKAVDCSLVVCK